MRNIELLDLSIAHYSRMREFVLRLSENEIKELYIYPVEFLYKLYKKMYSQIGEGWHGKDCSLCNNYFKEVREQHEVKIKCTKCPLDELGYNCKEKNSVWNKLNESRDIDKWLSNAERMIELLCFAKKEYEEKAKQKEKYLLKKNIKNIKAVITTLSDTKKSMKSLLKSLKENHKCQGKPISN
jgi:hypothetical protein